MGVGLAYGGPLGGIIGSVAGSVVGSIGGYLLKSKCSFKWLQILLNIYIL